MAPTGLSAFATPQKLPLIHYPYEITPSRLSPDSLKLGPHRNIKLVPLRLSCQAILITLPDFVPLLLESRETWSSLLASPHSSLALWCSSLASQASKQWLPSSHTQRRPSCYSTFCSGGCNGACSHLVGEYPTQTTPAHQC